VKGKALSILIRTEQGRFRPTKTSSRKKNQEKEKSAKQRKISLPPVSRPEKNPYLGSGGGEGRNRNSMPGPHDCFQKKEKRPQERGGLGKKKEHRRSVPPSPQVDDKPQGNALELKGYRARHFLKKRKRWKTSQHGNVGQNRKNSGQPGEGLAAWVKSAA